MSGEHLDLTTRLEAWLVDGPAKPAGLRDEVLTMVARTPQRHGRWRRILDRSAHHDDPGPAGAQRSTWSRPRDRGAAASPRRARWDATALLAAGLTIAVVGAALIVSLPGPPDPVASLPGGLKTVEAEAGVWKVVSDDAGHALDGVGLRRVAAGPDGGVWVAQDARVATLGRPGWIDLPAGSTTPTGLDVAPDGTVLAIDSVRRLRSFDGATWRDLDPGLILGEVEVGADGTVWMTGTRGYLGGPRVGRLGPDGTWSFGDDGLELVTQADDGLDLAVAPDGTAWLGIAFFHAGSGSHDGLWRGLLRFDGNAWTPVHPVGDRADLSVGPLAAGPDGTLWVHLATRGGGEERYLARYQDGEWTVMASDAAMPRLVGRATYQATMAVDGTGRLWMVFSDPSGAPGAPNVDDLDLPSPLGPQPGLACPGVLSFDGETWRQYLVGVCANDLSIGPDGAVWVTAAADRTRTSVSDVRGMPGAAGLYVIDPRRAGEKR